MTVASSLNRKTFAGNGVTTSFGTSPLVFFDSADLIVTVTDDTTGEVTSLVENTDYAVTGGGTVPATGTVSLAGGSSPYGAPASGTTVTILRDVAITQETDYEQNDGSDAEVSEAALDRLTMITQRLADRADRTLFLPDGDVTGASMEIPALEDRASTALGFDADGALAVYEPASAVTASENVTFLPSGTGATTSTVADELGRWVRPENFGAVADGTTDDSSALTKANTRATSFATGGEVRFTAGKTYRVSANVTFDSDVTLWFEDGARLTIDVGITVTAPGAVISLGGVPNTGSGTFTTLFGVLCVTPGGSLGIGTTNPNVHAGDDGTATRVAAVFAQTAALFLGITNRTPAAGNSVASFEGYSAQQTAPHDELGALRIVWEGSTAGQRGGAVAILTKDNASTTFSEKVRVHSNGNVLISEGGVGSANRSGAAAGTCVVTVAGKTSYGVLELATGAADASGLVSGDLLFIHNLNTTGEKRIARIEGITNGATATDRGGDMVFFTKLNGGALTERLRIKESGLLEFNGALDMNAPAASAAASHMQLGNATQSTIGANGAASALTANPLGYMVAYLGSTKIVFPYYNG